ncbi:MAG: hypothetical protein V3S51_03030 [Dehalococcoidia bacterium]
MSAKAASTRKLDYVIVKSGSGEVLSGIVRWDKAGDCVQAVSLVSMRDMA